MRLLQQLAGASVPVLLLTSCGGGGSIDLPSPTRSITGSFPSSTSSPSTSENPTETENPTEAESPAETSAPPSEIPSESPSSSEPTAVTSSSSPAAGEADAAGSEEDGGIPSWVWWLLAGLVLLGGVLAVILLPRARRRRAWDGDLAAAEGQVSWFARELLPALQQAGSPDAVAGGWQVATGRVTQAEDQLTGLETSAPDQARRSRARSLRDAVRAAHQGVESLLVSRDPDALPRDLTSIATQLEAALNPIDPNT